MTAAARPDAFRYTLRVYWEDTDAGGIVFYANHLKYYERARTEWLRALGHGQEQLRVEAGLIFVVTDTSVHYVQPARLDDLLDVTVELRHKGGASLEIAQQAWRQAAGAATLLSTGTIRIACVDAATLRPRRIPPFLADAIG
jgi:acyl-CoA thioester hydrolase